MTENQKFLETTTHNVAWIAKRYEANELELSAPYQRNPVWSNTQKSYLIDSIIHGYPVPELYIQEFTDADGDDRYIVVDGQQRVRACVEFIRNEYPLESTGKQVVENEGCFFNDLDPDIRKKIYNYKFVVRQLPDMSDLEIRAIFSRINRNTVALNPQELRHSTYWGPFIRTMEVIAKDKRWQDLGVFSANDIRRMLDVEFISELAIAYLHGTQNKKSKLDEWYAAYENEFEQQKNVIAVFRQSISLILMSLPQIASTRYSKKSDFYTLFQLFATEREVIGKMTPRAVNESLIPFGKEVDAFLSGKNDKASPFVKGYADAVERAASDFANRKQRLEILKKVVAP